MPSRRGRSTTRAPPEPVVAPPTIGASWSGLCSCCWVVPYLLALFLYPIIYNVFISVQRY